MAENMWQGLDWKKKVDVVHSSPISAALQEIITVLDAKWRVLWKDRNARGETFYI